MVLFTIIKPWLMGFVKESFSQHPILFTVLVGSASVAFIYFTLFRKAMRKEHLQSVKEQKQGKRKAQFENLKSKFKSSPELTKIANLDWETLVSQLQSRKLTAVQVLKAYMTKSLEATSTCNAITEYYPKAMAIAESLDKLPKVKGPLHGVPFAVKDDTDLESMDSVLGFARNCFKPKEKSAGLVLTLIELGGVPFCKTNVPQTLLNYASDNPVFGTTTSSHNPKLSPGGSSSGSGALVGASGTLFATGTDIGGSVRIPAHFNGVSGLKPTAGRFSMQGVSGTLPNVMGLLPTTGIIGQNAKIVTSVCSHILTDSIQTKFDPLLAPIPWNSQLYASKKKLRIGYFTQMPYLPPVGDTIETVEKAVAALRAQGHTLVPITELPDGGRIMRCAANYLVADEGRQLKLLWKGEEVANCAKLNQLVIKLPQWVIRFAKFLTQQRFLSFLYSPSMAVVMDAFPFKSYQLWENDGERKKITEEILGTWTKLSLDCVVCPVMPFPAIPWEMPGLLPIAALYTMTWNIVNFPAGVIRFGYESGKKIDKYDTRGDVALKMSQKGCKESIGSPIGVQVVGLPYQEELVLRIMEDLEKDALKK